MTVENRAVFAKSACYLTTHIWNWIHYCFSVSIHQCVSQFSAVNGSRNFDSPTLCYLNFCTSLVRFPVAARWKAWVCVRSLAGILGSNPTGGMDVCVA
jgi:hypothetical protein